ncbi:MAG: N-succinylarginine dihydrolase [Pseudomonadota bacterium]
MTAREYNFDGLIGPTHNYAGLSLGNIASASNAGGASRPKTAALQGLEKMKRLRDLGLGQGFLPPHERPHLPTLRQMGFSGSDEEMIAAAANAAPGLLANIYSASAMWTANAATVAPAADSADGKVHFTAANLSTMFHRSLEAETTARILKHIFNDDAHFAHHAPLPAGGDLGDEGAANHGRLCPSHGDVGVQLFVYGDPPDDAGFPARQARATSAAIARLHGLAADKTLLLAQSRRAIDAGAFHNDVVGVANESVLFCHEAAFEDRDGALAAIRAAAPYAAIIEAPEAMVPLKDAITSYIFNSQLLTLPSGGMALVLPTEAEENSSTKAYLDAVVAADNPVTETIFVNVRESMRNGGGPACLRLRVVLTDAAVSSVAPSFILSDDVYALLVDWVSRRYRDELHPEDLSDPALAREGFEALDEMTQILKMGAFYDFQR